VLVDTLPVDLLQDESPDGVARRLTAGIAMRSRVLEIGCGTGALARVIARRGANVTAIDRAPMIDLARSRTPAHLGIDYRVGELHRLSPRGFDVAIAVNARLERDALPRIAAAVRPGGSIVIIDRLGPWWATLSEIRRVIERVLPDAIVRRHLGWRYSVRWTRPV
jgi:2-polyprenyl-3-methyl-5-hydroxy-6-metoxy-1,4-benzoquinol methylase